MNAKNTKRVKSGQRAVADVAIALSQRPAAEPLDIERRFPGGHVRLIVGEISVSQSETKGRPALKKRGTRRRG